MTEQKSGSLLEALQNRPKPKDCMPYLPLESEWDEYFRQLTKWFNKFERLFVVHFKEDKEKTEGYAKVVARLCEERYERQKQLKETIELIERRLMDANEYGEIPERDGVTEQSFLQSITKKFEELLGK